MIHELSVLNRMSDDIEATSDRSTSANADTGCASQAMKHAYASLRYDDLASGEKVKVRKYLHGYTIIGTGRLAGC